MKDVLLNKVSKEEILSMLKCIRCGSIENIKPYKHKEKAVTGHKRYRRSSITETMTWTQEFPACTKCFKKFKKWKKTRTIFKVILALILIPFWILILINVWILMNESISTPPIDRDYGSLIPNTINRTLIQTSPFILLLITAGVSSIIHKGSKNNPSHFMKTEFGLTMVKPESSDEWQDFEIWAKLVLNERVIQGTMDPTLLIEKGIVKAPVSKFESDKAIKKDIKNCPKCGNMVILSKSHICEVCGYEFK